MAKLQGHHSLLSCVPDGAISFLARLRDCRVGSIARLSLLPDSQQLDHPIGRPIARLSRKRNEIKGNIMKSRKRLWSDRRRLARGEAASLCMTMVHEVISDV
jgi:hypothetical protein